MKMMASTEGAEREDLCVEELCLEDKVDALALSVGMIHKKMDRLLAMLDSKENKKMKDRVRIKQKRDRRTRRRRWLPARSWGTASRAPCTPIPGFHISGGHTSCWSLGTRTSSCAGS